MLKEIISKIKNKLEYRKTRKKKINLQLIVTQQGKQMLMSGQTLPYSEVLCVSSTTEDSIEYLNIKIYNSFKNEYLQFCDNYQLDSSKLENWNSFIENVVGIDRLGREFSKYVVINYTYSIEDFARFMRAFINYQNVGCSFELWSNVQVDFTEDEEEEDIFEYPDKVNELYNQKHSEENQESSK